MTLTAHLHILPRFRIRGALPSVPYKKFVALEEQFYLKGLCLLIRFSVMRRKFIGFICSAFPLTACLLGFLVEPFSIFSHRNVTFVLSVLKTALQ